MALIVLNGLNIFIIVFWSKISLVPFKKVKPSNNNNLDCTSFPIHTTIGFKNQSYSKLCKDLYLAS